MLCFVLCLIATQAAGQRWTATYLDSAPGMIRTQAKSINDDGTILGYAVKTGEASQRPATWRNGTWTLLSVPTEVSASLRFNDGAKINASGETLVSVNFNTNIRWLNNIPSVLRPPLGTTLAAEAPYTATHMDNRGRVVGGYTYGAAGQYPLPFLWQRTSEYATIQDLPLGAIAGIMHRINDSGNIIGYAQDPTRGYEMAPVIWRRGIPRYLREVCPELRRGLPPYYGAQALALWDRVLDINNKDVVVGTALYLNSNHEWVRLPVQCKQGKMTAFELPSTYVGGGCRKG